MLKDERIPKNAYLAANNQDIYTFMKLLVHVLLMLVLVFCGFSTQTDAQSLNPPKVGLKVLQGQSSSVLFVSTRPIEIVSSSNLGTATALVQEVNLNLEYNLVVQTDPNQEGTIQIVVEHKEPISDVRYSVVEIKVVKSLLEAQPDFVNLPKSSGTFVIDVLANDTPGSGLSSVIGVEMLAHGNAVISSDKIEFTPEQGFEGMAGFVYRIRDEKGVQSTSSVSVNIGNSNLNGSTLSFVVANTSSQLLLIDNSGYALTDPDALFKGSIGQSGDALIYTPNRMAKGFELFSLTNSLGETINVEIEILDNQVEEDQLVDDQYFMLPSTTIQFDPRANDFSKNGIVVGYSNELQYTNGTFQYSGPSGFSGVKGFYYDILEGSKISRGNIEIFIGNYLPQHETYSLQTFKSSPLVIEYEIPVRNFSWSLITSPKNGSVFTNLGAYIPTDYCQSESGHQMIVYRPNNNFTGADQFVVNYCTGLGICKTVSINVNVVASNNACHCIGSDCAWAGDANNDGVVNVADLLAIGYNYGENGNLHETSEGSWYGKEASNWAFDQSDAGINLKYADSNGDGFIDSQDTLAIRTNMGKYHSLVPSSVVAQKEIAIQFVPNSPTANPGDMVTYDIIIGSASNPVKDLRGLVLGFQVPENMVTPGSIKLNFDPAGWFSSLGSTMSMTYVKPTSAEGAITKINDFGISGSGKIGSTSLVIKESSDGIRPAGDKINLGLGVLQAFITDGSGRQYQVPVVIQDIEVNVVDTKPALKQAEVVVFPNPSQGNVVFHANNDDNLREIQIFNMLGARVYSKTGLDQKSIELGLALDAGVYFAEVKTNMGISVQKLQILN